MHKLCWICQDYIYISRCLVVYAQCVGVYVVSVSIISAGCECVYIMRICVYAKCLYVYIPACSCINWVMSAKLFVFICQAYSYMCRCVHAGCNVGLNAR